MSENTLKINAILDSISTRKDKSLKLVFETNEVSDEEGMKLLKMRDQYGWLSFSEHKREITEDTKIFYSGELEGKTPSQRLRAVLYVYWQHSGSHGVFQSFYELQINRMIEKIKERLD